MHEGKEVREFYSRLPHPVLVGIEAIGPMQWFLNLLEELGIECQVGDATKIRAAEPRKQKHDRRDAELILKLWWRNGFRRSGCPTRNSSICAARCCIGISGCVCARRYKMPCRLSRWPTDCDAVPACGTMTGKRRSRSCPCRHTPLCDGVHCKLCIATWTKKSKS